MLPRKSTKWIWIAGAALASVALASSPAQAHWGRWGSWGCSGGCWGSSGGCWGGHHHRGWYSSGGSCGGWATYYGCCGGSWGSSGGSSGGYYYYGAPMQGAPAAPPTAPSTDGSAPAPGSDTTPPPSPMPGAVYRQFGGSQVALLNVNVPAEAKIFVNGNTTSSTGTQRQYISRGLQAGSRYAYEVRAEMVRDGKTLTEIKTVTLGPGQQINLAFDFATSEEAPVTAGNGSKTKLTLRVPADAKVILGGNETRSTGEVREFTTSKLAPGAAWENYTVRVVANVDGREVTKEETITLAGGENRELTFDFDSSEIAQTAAVTR